MISHLLSAIRFVPLDPSSPKLFGFSELLAGLALMVLAWTIADSRYRFRVSIAPVPLQRSTFAVVVVVGVLSLLTDLWRAQSWPVPEGNLITPAEWQAVLAGAFLLTFLAWAWFAFIRPPTYGRLNSLRYARALYRTILKGSVSELAVIADEVARSAGSLIRFATEGRPKGRLRSGREIDNRRPNVASLANDILLLIADARFCCAIVESSPGTALAIFREIARTGKYEVRIKQFAKNILNEALLYKNSFLFHETEGYESGFMGYFKPLSKAMFSNYAMAESIGTLFDVDLQAKLDSTQLKAYCRIVLLTFRDYVGRDHSSYPSSLYSAFDYIARFPGELYKINGTPDLSWENDILARTRVVVGFFQEAVDILNESEPPNRLGTHLRTQGSEDEDFYDRLAKAIVELIASASAVRFPPSTCWWVQY
ncbi:MAG: hypothetical protein IMZ61_10605, partial [Planctomycetes bacterium]|nr:hypothetical protein [Planctomycetota bacterium]